MRYAGSIIISIFALFLTGCATLPMPAPIGNSPPVIDDYWASPTARVGDQWRIYVKAHDPDGDMATVKFNIEQAGGVAYRNGGRIILRPDQWRRIDGYFWMEIFVVSVALPDPILHMQFTDRGGRKSQLASIPIHIGRIPQQKAPAGFADNRILPTYITIQNVDDEANNTWLAP